MEKLILNGIGADVEVFIKDKTTNEIVSAEGFIKGTKKNPFVFSEHSRHFATSLDNVMAEFGIPPAKTKEEFCNNLKISMDYISSILPENLCTVAFPAAELDYKWLTTKSARTFGCEPDFNAYTLNFNPPPMSIISNLRSAGGHLHLGYENPFPIFDMDYYSVDSQRSEIVKALDLFIGVPSVILEPDNKRKELYGKAGAFRPKEYGLEYRTVSNFYLNSKKLTEWVYEAINKAAEWLNSLDVFPDDLSKRVQSVINESRKDEAEKLILQYNLL